MRASERLPAADRPEWDAVYDLLVSAADMIENDDVTLTGGLLDEGAICTCLIWHLPETEAAWWITRQAKYQIAATLAIPPRHRDDPLIGLVIDVLAHHPPQVQAHILRAAARRLAYHPPRARPTA